MANDIVFTCGLDPDLARALDSYLASAPSEDRASIIRKALAEFLRHHGAESQMADELDELDFELAEEARRRMADPDDEVIPYEQARAELGL